jgi:coenzyme PQQ precursor peptide PqqA
MRLSSAFGFSAWEPVHDRLTHTGRIDSIVEVGYSYCTFGRPWPEREMGIIMEWTAPAFEEICLNCEINSYASAKL